MARQTEDDPAGLDRWGAGFETIRDVFQRLDRTLEANRFFGINHINLNFAVDQGNIDLFVFFFHLNELRVRIFPQFFGNLAERR